MIVILRRLQAAVVVPALLTAAVPAGAADPRFEKLQIVTPRDDRISAVDLNARGDVAGTEWAEDAADSNIVMEFPFLARGKAMTRLPLLEGYTATFPAAVSDAGVVVGRSSKPGSIQRRVLFRNQAFVWDAKSGIRGLGGAPGGVASIASGISRDGARISGYSVGDGRITPCVWDRVGDSWKATLLPQQERLGPSVVAISGDGRYVAALDGAVPCVWSQTGDGAWTREPIGDPGALVPRAVNSSAVVVGFTIDAHSRKHAVVRTREAGCMRVPEPDGFVQSEAHDVNNDGAVVGIIERDADGELEPRAFIFHGDRLRLIDEGGPNFIDATAINDAWQVAGVFERDEEEAAKQPPE